MYGECIDRIVAANTSNHELTITAGTPAAEFHVRTTDSMQLQPRDVESVLANKPVSANTAPDKLSNGLGSSDGVNPGMYGNPNTMGDAGPLKWDSCPPLDNRNLKYGVLIDRHMACGSDAKSFCDDSIVTLRGGAARSGAESGGREDTQVHESGVDTVGRSAISQSKTDVSDDFGTEPLKSVDLKHHGVYTEEEKRKLKQCAWDIRDTLSDGILHLKGTLSSTPFYNV